IVLGDLHSVASGTADCPLVDLLPPALESSDRGRCGPADRAPSDCSGVLCPHCHRPQEPNRKVLPTTDRRAVTFLFSRVARRFRPLQSPVCSPTLCLGFQNGRSQVYRSLLVPGCFQVHYLSSSDHSLVHSWDYRRHGAELCTYSRRVRGGLNGWGEL